MNYIYRLYGPNISFFGVFPLIITDFVQFGPLLLVNTAILFETAVRKKSYMMAIRSNTLNARSEMRLMMWAVSGTQTSQNVEYNLHKTNSLGGHRTDLKHSIRNPKGVKELCDSVK